MIDGDRKIPQKRADIEPQSSRLKRGNFPSKVKVKKKQKVAPVSQFRAINTINSLQLIDYLCLPEPSRNL